MFGKSGLVFILLCLLVMSGISQAYAEDSWRQWKNGEVTKEPWDQGPFSKIEVNNIPYTFMPGAKIYRVTKERHGGFNKKPISQQHVYQTQKVEMLVQGFRIYQLNVTP